MNSNVRNLVLWLVILCLVALVWAVVKTGKPQGAQPGFSALVQDVKAGKVEKIALNSVTGDVHGKWFEANFRNKVFSFGVTAQTVPVITPKSAGSA